MKKNILIKGEKKQVFYFGLYLCFITFCISSCQKETTFYTIDDFSKVPKIDLHFHYNTTDLRYLKFADSLNFKLVSPNVDTEMPITEQLEITRNIKKLYPDKFAFFGTFSIEGFGKPDYIQTTIAYIDKCMQAGACGIKIWKNIGMDLKDSTGKYVMVDDPALEPVFSYLEEKNIPVLAHLGEPRNCWLPEEEMTLANDLRYYKKHPQYHMYLHPEAPSYEDQINARDNIVERHPKLDFTGAHLASLEWNVDELAKRFDKFPNFKADLSARMGHLQYQSLSDPERVRNFMIKYQDRLIYGTDVTISEADTNYIKTVAWLRTRWTEHWIYLATDSSVIVNDLGKKEVKGLNLPREVIDKIYFKNAEHFFNVR